MRQQITSGTHAISLSLFALTRPGDNILSISGLPYDTLHSTIGLNNECGSLKEYGIFFDYVDLINNDFDYNAIENRLKEGNIKKFVFTQKDVKKKILVNLLYLLLFVLLDS